MAKLPEVITDKAQMRSWSRSQRLAGKTVALVPTMGFLHKGHLALVEEAKRHAQAIAVSIYVNPGQFAPSEDLSTYPSDLNGDLRKLAEIGGVDVVFCPRNLYDYDGKDGSFGGSRGGEVGEKGGNLVSCLEKSGGEGEEHETWIRVEKMEKVMCGKSRPVLFRGVATVVTKLFNIVEPDVAVFGKKDYQQWRIIRKMVHDLDFAINIIGSDIVREADGLAMSSRNVHLSPEERNKALSISLSLSEARSAAMNGQASSRDLITSVVQKIAEAGGRVDYVEIVDQESLEAVEEVKRPVVFCVAAWFGKVRLIDNIEFNVSTSGRPRLI